MNRLQGENTQLFFQILILAVILFLPLAAFGQDDEDEDFISPVRPTVSESAEIHKEGRSANRIRRRFRF